MWKAAHIATALHIVLAAQRVNADAGPADITRGHGKVGNRDNGGRTLAMLGNAQPVINCPIATGCVKPCCLADQFSGNAGKRSNGLRAVGLTCDKRGPLGKISHVAALAYKGLIHQSFGNNHMRQCVDHRNICTRPQRQMELRLDMRRANQVDPARVHHDKLGTFPQAFFHPGRKHGVSISRVGADDEDNVGLINTIKILRTSGSTKGALQPVAGGRVTDACTSIHIVVAKSGTDKFLHKEGLFVRATRRGNTPDRIRTIFRLNPLELGGRVGDRLFPVHFAPRVGNFSTDHRFGDAILMRGITPGKTSLHAGVAMIRLTILVRHHAHHVLTAHLCLEGAANTAIGASGND